MARHEGWIEPTDAKLLASVTRHEGDKPIIYAMLKSGTLQAASQCDAQTCMRDGTWPAYIDSEGLDTVGVGHLITGVEAYDAYAGVSDQVVKTQLAEDLAAHLDAAVDLASSMGMNIAGNDVVQRFMTEMCFNIGVSGYRGFRNGLKKLASAVNGDGQWRYGDAADEHLDSKWARQVKGRAQEMVDTLRALD